MLELDPLKKTCSNCDLYCTHGNKCPELPHMPHDACDKWVPTYDYKTKLQEAQGVK